ncbi:MAG: hypothetical protein H0T86_15235 [Gemmatimonadales bacterium]|nr:hypothetical protein [Gemmatimonadales bacterium]
MLSLVGIVAGLVVVGGFLSGRRLDGWAAVFLVTTLLANAGGFAFPFVKLLPSHGLGVLSLLILPAVIAARYWKRLAGGWRTTYVVGTVAALYFNVFVLVAQLFHRIPAMIALAPTQSEPPFLVTQLLVLGLSVVLGRGALRAFGAQAAVVGDRAHAREAARVA